MTRPLVRAIVATSLGGLGLAGCATPSVLPPRDAQLVAGKTYVITGASSGFGRGVALAVGRYRANVVLAARRGEVLEQVASEIRAVGGTALVVVTDVSRSEDIDRLKRAALGKYGRIDIWINNAAVGTIGRFDTVPLADHARVIDVNVKGVIFGSHAALTQFRAQGYGTLINIGSVESKVPLAYHSSYTASKHAVLGLSEALSQELRLDGQKHIKVVTVMPWAADTAFWQHAANYSGRTPRMPWMDKPDKVVDAITWMSIHPRKRISVGWKAEAVAVGDHILPGLTEHVAADIAHGFQIDRGPVAPNTSGSLHQPITKGTGVEGGNRERIRQEERALKGKAPVPPLQSD
ncbi:SDR family NAD(P)-dependent oxidoreductase [Sphingomonas sp.]|uniref:SDR family NAD(P)-dependent oxidoreductase n=1 Tax=Sphingomonas sp. TaxID=28214 RepID=UPI003B3A59DE